MEGYFVQLTRESKHPGPISFHETHKHVIWRYPFTQNLYVCEMLLKSVVLYRFDNKHVIFCEDVISLK